jgi:hypothetical protein
VLNQAKVAMTFTTRARVMPPATLKGEFSSLPGRKRTRPHACANPCPVPHHGSAGSLWCWQRDGCVRERDLAAFAARGGSQRLSEGDDAAARHGQGSDTNRAARAQHAPPKGEKRGRTRLASPSFLCENNYLTLNLFRMTPCRTGLGRCHRPTTSSDAATNACESTPRVALSAEAADAIANGCRRRGRACRAAIGAARRVQTPGLPALVPNEHANGRGIKAVARIVDLRAVGKNAEHVHLCQQIDVTAGLRNAVDHGEMPRRVDWYMHEKIHIGDDIALSETMLGEFK